MKSSVYLTAAFAATMLLTVSAQAENKGEQIFKQKCAMCHVVNGKGGTIGPELTTVASRLKEADLKSQLESPKKKNASSLMPSFRTLTKPDLEAVLGYLKTLK